MKYTLPTLQTLFSRKSILPRRRTGEPFRSRLLVTERLETRAMLAADALSAWQNQILPADVNADGYVTPMDALRVINELNASGARDLSAPAPSISRVTFMSAGEAPKNYYDVNGDGHLSAVDALIVINRLNAAADEQVRIRAQVTDMAGNPIDVIAPGQDFQIRGFVKDLREPQNDPQRGVFEVYVDVNYDPTKMAVDLAGRTIEYGSEYPNQHRPISEITATPGVLDDIGAFAGLTPLGSAEQLLFIVPMTATGRGTVSVTLDPEDSDVREVAVFGSGDAVPDNEILFVGDQATIGFPPNAANDTATVAEDTQANVINVLANDTPNTQGQGPLTVVAVVPGAHGSVGIAGGGTGVIYTPIGDFFGQDTFTYTIEDANGDRATATVTVTVTNVNDPPTANADTFVVDADTADNVLDVLANDTSAPDVGETLTVSAVGMSAQGGTVTTVAGGLNVRYTPPAGFRGTDTFTYTISDGNGGTSQALVTVTVSSDNPIARPDTFSGMVEDSTNNTLDVLANDELAPGVEGELLIVGTGPTSNGGVVTIALDSKSLIYTPARNLAGTETFTYRVIDGQGGESTGMVSVTVTDVNDLPTARDDAFTLSEDSVNVPLFVLANDTIAPDTGEALTITNVSAASAGGTVTISLSGTNVLYTPAPNFFGQEAFTYTISDGRGGTATAIVVVTVTDVTETPVANNDTFTVNEDSTDNVFNVLTNDTDPDAGDVLTISAVSAGSRGGAITIGPGATSIRYTAAANVFGTETFTYTISDGHGGTAMATVTVQITAVNDPPTANNDSLMVLENSTDNPLDVLQNDSFAPDEGETLTITAVSVPSAGGAVTIAGNMHSLIYTPAADFNGPETFSYTIDDGTGLTATAMVTVQVNNVNNPPNADDDTFNVDEDSAAIELNVLDNDSFAPDAGETLTITSFTVPNHGGTVTIAEDSLSLIYTPLSNFHGGENFTYTISDGNGGTDTATVTINVLPVNDLPPIANDTFTVAEDSQAFELDVLANDLTLPNPDGVEPIFISAVGAGSQQGTITRSQDNLKLLYTPKANFVGTETFTYTISDTHGGTATANVTVTVTPVNDNPALIPDSFSVDANSTSNVLNVLGNDSDPDAGDVLTITGVGARTNSGTVMIATDGRTLLYTPAAGFSGEDTFSYTVRDEHGGTATSSVTVTVRALVAGSLSGFVYRDSNANGLKEGTEQGMANVTIRLWGTDVMNHRVDITTTTDATGAYRFSNVMPGSYVIEETQPNAFSDGFDTIGSQGGIAGHDQFFITLASGQNGANNNFGEGGLRSEFIGRPNFFLP